MNGNTNTDKKNHSYLYDTSFSECIYKFQDTKMSIFQFKDSGQPYLPNVKIVLM